MFFNSCKLVAIAAAMLVCSQSVAQTYGYVSYGQETSTNCGRGITQMEAAGLWSNYCTETCFGDSGHRGCGGGLFNRGRCGGCGLFGGLHSHGCGGDAFCETVEAPAPAVASHDSGCNDGCGCGSRFRGLFRGRLGGRLGGCGDSCPCNLGRFGYPSDCGTGCGNAVADAGCHSCNSGCGFGNRLQGLGNRIGNCNSCGSRIRGMFAGRGQDCGGCQPVVAMDACGCNDGCGSRLRGLFSRHADRGCCEPLTYTDPCADPCRSGCGGKLRGLFNRDHGCQNACDPCGGSKLGGLFDRLGNVGCRERCGRQNQCDPCGGGNLRGRLSGIFHRGCGRSCGFFDQCTNQGAMTSCVAGCSGAAATMETPTAAATEAVETVEEAAVDN